jgi:two-component system, chemotaxis family, chemotaxis protein CheY
MMGKILIVDDSNLSRRLLRRLLEPAGHLVIEASDGMTALEQYALEQPDMVLLDMTMIGMHGLDVLHQLRQLDPHARVVAASADVQSSTRAMVMSEGGLGFITKPFVAGEVLSAIQTALEAKDDTH